MGDFMGVIGGAVVSTQILNVDSFAYWMHTRDFVDSLDIFAGVFKSYFFGAAIALVSCHRGFNSKAGAEGVGRAATEAFVLSFIAILIARFRPRARLEQCLQVALSPGARTVMSQGAAQSGARGDNLIEVRHVSMRFRYQQVLRDIDLTIHRGETVCIIGESGCGKTVMLKLLIGLLRPTQGSVWFDGRDVASFDGKELVKMRLRFGFLFQMAALFDSLTVFDNVAFGLREHHICDEAHVRQIVTERLHEVGLPPEVESKKPAELSGGQRKRVGLARALAIGPEVMLYDEPTTGLDPIMSDVINELILQTQQSMKTTGVVVTHDMKTVTKVADRVIMLYPLARLGPHDSQILYDGPAADLEQSPDPRVGQFVRGEAGERLREMAQQRTAASGGPRGLEPALAARAPKNEGEHERATHAVPDRHVRHCGGTGPDHDDRLVR